MKRVVVTGLGTTSPLGGDVASTWAAMLAGESGVGPLKHEWAEQLSTQIAAEAAVDPTDVLDRVKARRLDRSGQLALVAALEAVDAVTWFEDDTPEALIEACRPEVLVKGGDWPVERIAGAPGVLARGGRVLSIPFEHERSTTALLARIRATRG